MFGVITLATSKGGAGKSTLARSLAAHWFALGHRPALVDADPQRSLANRYDPNGRLKVPVIAEPEEDQLELLGRLIEKLRRALAVKHIADSEHGLQITEPLVVRGLIDWDSEQGGSTPLLVIDGREISWDEFGRMISGFEGFQFKLEIRDKSEEI